MKNKLIVLVAATFFGFFLPFLKVEAAGFPDVKSYEKEIEYLLNKSIIQGFPDGSFGPKENVTRLQAVRMLLKAKGINDLSAPNPNLTDMWPGKHGYNEIAKAVELGIISGKTAENGSRYFDPSGHLTRGQMAKIIVEAERIPFNTSFKFSDVPSSSGYFTYVSTLASARITEGYDDGTYRPALHVSREHFAVFVSRMLNDEFKTKPATYLVDKTKVYSWEYYNGSQAFRSKVNFVEPRRVGSGNWDLWKESAQDGEGYFVTLEDSKGLYENACYFLDGVVCQENESWKYTALAYPLTVGKEWVMMKDVEDPVKAKVIALNKTIQTKAGKFTRVVEIKDSDGVFYYYARDIGLIKTIENGVVSSELVRLENR